MCKFQAIQGYVVKLCFKKSRKKNPNRKLRSSAQEYEGKKPRDCESSLKYIGRIGLCMPVLLFKIYYFSLFIIHVRI